MVERMLVIGGDAGGMSAAAQARRRRGPDDLEIVVVERGRFTSYSACGIPYWIGGVVDDRDELIARTPEEHRANDIDVRLMTEAVGIDLEAGTVEVRRLDEDGAVESIGYDTLLLAPGAVPIRPDLPGIEAEGVHGIQTLEDGDRVRRDLEEVQDRRAVVVGGGYIGLEMAEALKMRGFDVVVVEQGEQPMGSIDPDMGALVADALRAEGIEVRTGESAEGFETADGRIRAVVTDAGTLPADVVVLGLGVRPDTRLAEDAGVPLGPSGAVAVDRGMRTRSEAVWAAGDCTEKLHRVTGQPVAFALGTHANKQGRVAGINIGGGYAAFPGVVGTAVSRVCAAEVARTGLSEREAAAAGFGAVAAIVRSTTRASYFPGASALTVKVVAERRSGTLLGAQIVGEEGAGKRIDVFATALWCGLTVDELVNVDLSYAPPVAPLWDPVLIAARKAWQAVEEDLHDH